jgi:uncharacterized protein
MSGAVTFRPHHFLCALGFQGKGYSDAFTANMAGIVDRLRAPDGAGVDIEVTFQADHICAPCPLRRGCSCEHAAKIAGLDTRHARALGLHEGMRLTWGAARARIRDAVPPGALSNLCAGCSWLEAGLCESALRALHDEAQP